MYFKVSKLQTDKGEIEQINYDPQIPSSWAQVLLCFALCNKPWFYISYEYLMKKEKQFNSRLLLRVVFIYNHVKYNIFLRMN